MRKGTILAAGSALWALALSGPLVAQEDKVAAAQQEGVVAIYTSTDISQAQDLIDAFKAKYPGIEVEYNDLGTVGVYNRAISEAAAGQVGADLIWSSAMDLQMRMYEDGLLAKYESPEAEALPEWAVLDDTLYATTLEPVGMIYNTRAFPDGDGVPSTRAELIELIGSGNHDGKIATFDPEKSGSGFLFHTNDVQNTDNFWELAEAFGKHGGKTYSSTGAMRESVVSGENVLAFNVIGSYALDWAKDSETLGVAFFEDQNAAFSRLISLAEGAPHPNAGQLFLDFVLSKEGQEALAGKGLPSVRTDTEVGLNAQTLAEAVPGEIVPIPLGDNLLTYLDQMKRVEFLRQWQSAMHP